MTILQIFTLAHVLIALTAIASGLVVVLGLIRSRGRQLWTFLFLVTTALTTLTGFFFPFHGVTPALILGVVSIVPITLAFLARYQHRLRGGWRGTYVAAAVVSLYFNFFVLIVQAFEKVPALEMLAPTQKEPPFQIAQLATLVLFIVLGVLSFKRFRPQALTLTAE